MSDHRRLGTGKRRDSSPEGCGSVDRPGFDRGDDLLDWRCVILGVSVGRDLGRNPGTPQSYFVVANIRGLEETRPRESPTGPCGREDTGGLRVSRRFGPYLVLEGMQEGRGVRFSTDALCRVGPGVSQRDTEVSVPLSPYSDLLNHVIVRPREPPIPVSEFRLSEPRSGPSCQRRSRLRSRQFTDISVRVPHRPPRKPSGPSLLRPGRDEACGVREGEGVGFGSRKGPKGWTLSLLHDTGRMEVVCPAPVPPVLTSPFFDPESPGRSRGRGRGPRRVKDIRDSGNWIGDK